MPAHLALLGDSIFDNAAYVGHQPDVITHLRSMAPPGWRATLYAVDGATTRDVARQVGRIAPDVTHIVLSAGGNDALMNGDLLALPVRSTADALSLFAERLRAFEADYRSALDAVLGAGCDTTVCTIYNGHLEEPRATRARVALTTFNDVILRAAFERALTVIDLRPICSTPEDYANPIEPSGAGGGKIAAAIVAALSPGGAVAASRVVARCR